MSQCCQGVLERRETLYSSCKLNKIKYMLCYNQVLHLRRWLEDGVTE